MVSDKFHRGQISEERRKGKSALTRPSIGLGAMPQLKSGDILGHEFCGRVHSMGTGVKKFNKGQRVVASFQIACGRCEFCKRKQTSQCSRTNDNEQMKEMYGSSTAGAYIFPTVLLKS